MSCGIACYITASPFKYCIIRKIFFYITEQALIYLNFFFLAWKISCKTTVAYIGYCYDLYYCSNYNQRPEVQTPPHTSPLALIAEFSLAFVFGAELGVWYVLCAPRGAGPCSSRQEAGLLEVQEVIPLEEVLVLNGHQGQDLSLSKQLERSSLGHH